MSPLIFPSSQVQISLQTLLVKWKIRSNPSKKALFIKQGIYFRRQCKRLLYSSRSNVSFFLWNLFLASRAGLMTINRNECDQNIPSFQFVVTDLHGSANITMLISYCKLYLTNHQITYSLFPQKSYAGPNYLHTLSHVVSVQFCQAVSTISIWR